LSIKTPCTIGSNVPPVVYIQQASPIMDHFMRTFRENKGSIQRGQRRHSERTVKEWSDMMYSIDPVKY